MAKAGELKESIKIFTVNKISNDLGEMIRTNVLLKTVRCHVIYEKGDEVENNGQLTPIQTVTFNIRWDESIKEEMLIEYKTKLYNIRFIKPIRIQRITSIVTTKSK